MTGWPSWWPIAACAALLATNARALEPDAVFAKASRSVVVVVARTTSGKANLGSGVVLRKDTVATNCHVVADASRVEIRYGNMRAVATVLRQDIERDICLLRVSTIDLVPAIPVDPKSVRPGVRVYSIGSPQGLELTISEGLLSGIRETSFGSLIQTSAPISPGSSGGGLFNQDAALIGFTTLILEGGQNLNFAVPVSAAMNLLDNARNEEALSGAVKEALERAVAADAPPRPTFDEMDARLAYLRWLRASSERLKRSASEARSRIEFLETLWYESARAGLEPALVLGLIEVASNFRKYAVSPVGARGYMQVAERWSKTIGDGDSAKLFHMQSNLRFGCVILKHYIETGRNDTFTALVWYFGQATGKEARLTDAAAKSFAAEVLAARQRWLVE